MSKDFEELFDSSILESLEGALQEFSQLNSKENDSDDDQNGTEIEEDEDDDQSQYTEYTDYTDHTDHTYGTDFDGDEDPESGELELFAMMDSLVAELEMEIDNLEKGDVISGDMPLVILDDETDKTDEKKEASTPAKPKDLDYAPVSDYTNKEKPFATGLDDGADASTMNNEQGEKNFKRAKSLWKILSGLTHPYLDDGDDVANEEEIPKAESHEEGEESGNKSPPEEDYKTSEENVNFEKLKIANSGDADYANVSDYTATVPVEEYTNLKTPTTGDADYMKVSDYTKKHPSAEAERAAANAARSSYVPSKEDFQQLVGVLAEYTKRKRQHQRSTRDNYKYRDEDPEPVDDASNDKLNDKSIQNFTGLQAVPDFRVSAADTTFDKVELPTSEDPDYVPISDYSPKKKSIPDVSAADTTFDKVVSATSDDPDYVPNNDNSQQERLTDNGYEERQEVDDELNDKSIQELTGLQGPPDFGWESPADATFEKVELPTSKDPDYVPISDYSQNRRTRNGELLTPVDNSPRAASLTEGERKKTGRAIASYTMKKRREYMARKRQQTEEKGVPAHVTSGNDKQEVAAKSPHKTQANVTEKSSPSKVTRSNGHRRKKKKRTNKHRKGKPKKLEGSQAKQHQQEQTGESSQGAEPTSTRRARTRARVRGRTRQDDQQMRIEVIQALAETEAWHWIVKQVTAQNN